MGLRARSLRCEPEGDRGWCAGQRGSMGMVEWEEPGCLFARGTVRRLDLDQHRAAKGLPPTGVRGLLQDRSPPHSCDASRARPPSGQDEQGSSPDETEYQEQSENTTHPLRHHRARPGDPDPQSTAPHRIGMAGTSPAMTRGYRRVIPGLRSGARKPSPLTVQDRTQRCSLCLETS